METALLKAKSEMDVAKGKAQELEALVLKKDLIISEQKTLHNQIIVSNLDKVKVFMRELRKNIGTRKHQIFISLY